MKNNKAADKLQKAQQINPKILGYSINMAKNALLQCQNTDGHWCFEVEADCTISAEYILMMHFLDEIDGALQNKLTTYLISHQNQEGGWALYYGGPSDLSCSIKAYYALKLAGIDSQAPFMQKAKASILKAGGAAKANVFTRITLAQFEQIPWRGVPFVPVELILAPRWFPFHFSKISYWSRAVMIPLSVLCTLKAKAANPKKIDILELFTTSPHKEKNYFPIRSKLNQYFIWTNHVSRKIAWLIPKRLRQYAINRALDWTVERINTQHGLGGIFPAMVNAYEALKTVNRESDQTHINNAQLALKNLIVNREMDAYVQPCVSPVWDTALCLVALSYCDNTQSQANHGLRWLQSKQLSSQPGDWRAAKPNLEGGGWPFQYQNAHYPDLDDTALVAYTFTLYNQQGDYSETIQRATHWIVGMQSSNGGFASFDANNTYDYLNEISFADHGALLDLPSVDVSARVAMHLGTLGDPQWHRPLQKCLDYIFSEQENNGSWFGRWGTNYIYGTWSVLSALKEVGFSKTHPSVRAAAAWLKNNQNTDGGWGEDNGSYYCLPLEDNAPSTSFQTAWAILSLIAAGETNSIEIANGVQYLISTQQKDGFWHEPYFTAPGFPRVFYLKYHGYSKYFPLWALAQYDKEVKASL